MPKPKDNFQSGTDLERNGHLDVTASGADVCGFRTNRGFAVLRAQFSLDWSSIAETCAVRALRLEDSLEQGGSDHFFSFICFVVSSRSLKLLI